MLIGSACHIQEPDDSPAVAPAPAPDLHAFDPGNFQPPPETPDDINLDDGDMMDPELLAEMAELTGEPMVAPVRSWPMRVVSLVADPALCCRQ